MKMMMLKCFSFLFFYLSGYIFCLYMRFPFPFLFTFFVTFVLFYLFRYIQKFSIVISKTSRIVLYLFSFLFSFFLVLGKLLNIRADIFFGTALDNYVDDFSFVDFFAVFLLSFVMYILFSYLIILLSMVVKKFQFRKVTGISNKKFFFLISFLLFLFWFPYLLVYYPGIVPADTIVSINQAIDFSCLTNQFSIFYTFFIKFFIWFCSLFGQGVTFSLFLLMVFQMIYLSFCMSYLICWLRNKGFSKVICFLFILLYGCMPFYAALSASMFRDPIFSASLLIFSLFLIDCVISSGKLIEDKKFIIRIVLLCLIITLSRNNGYFVLLFTFLLIFVFHLFKKITIDFTEIGSICLIFVFLYLCILSPVYRYFHVEEAFSDSVGILLSQMSSVVVYDGKMSTEDRKFIDNMFPLEKFPNTYRPCVVDLLKWDRDFDDVYIRDHKMHFFQTYFHLLIQNPYLYLKSWALSTYGYWAFNHWELNVADYNISAGDLDQLKYNVGVPIDTKNFLKNRLIPVKKIFTIYGKNISLSILNWIIFFLVLLLFLSKNYHMLITLGPTLGVVFSLFIATPNAYWPRYGLLEYYMLPVYVFIFLISFSIGVSKK